MAKEYRILIHFADGQERILDETFTSCDMANDFIDEFFGATSTNDVTFARIFKIDRYERTILNSKMTKTKSRNAQYADTWPCTRTWIPYGEARSTAHTTKQSRTHAAMQASLE